MKVPTIFLIEEDNDTRPLFKRILENHGFKVILAINEEDALQRVSDSGPGNLRADLIIVDFIGKSIEEMLTAARRIRQQGEINIPFVVTASVYGEDMEGKNVQINENDWVTYLEDGQQLLSLLERLVKTNPLEIN